MSRHITIKVTFKNGKSRQRGIYNPTNAEYKKSELSYTDMYECLYTLKEEVKQFKLKKVEVTNSISTGNSRDCWESCTHHYHNLNDVEACKLVDVNNVLYQATL